MRRGLTALLLPLLLWAAAAEPDPSALNRAIGLPLVGAWSLNDLETRLRGAGIRLQHSSGRHSAFLNRRRLLGAPCAEIQIYTDAANRNVTSIGLVFANKGDVAKGYAQGIVAADRAIRNRLTELCGPPRRDHLGPGARKLQSSVEAWKTPAADFLLETEKREYLILHIRPAGTESARKPTRIRDADFSGRVRKNEFGDVWITGLPMVDQGRKGYCAPATMERVLLYFGIQDAGMHKLADAAKSDAGGGTTVADLLKAVKPLRRRTGLQYAAVGELRLSGLARHIDDGIPVFWCLHATGEYEQLRRANTQSRSRAANPREWKKQLKRQKTLRSPGRSENNHICLIIGYNRQTEEIAVSNSWGEKENRPSWVPLKAAQRVGQGVQFVIYP